MHRILVDEKRWISDNRFLHALNYCMLLPGPEAQQLATYIGWLLHRTVGGIVAGSLFVLPGFVSILALSVLYAGYRELPFVEALFYGLAPAVLAVVVEAVLRIGKRVLKNTAMVSIASCAFVAIFFFNVPFPVIVVGAGLVGFVGGLFRPAKFIVLKPHDTKGGSGGNGDYVLSDHVGVHTKPTLLRAAVVLAVFSGLWLGPLAVLIVAAGWDNVFVKEGLFFSKAAVVTFGGAYAVLAYMAQQAVDVYGWLEPGEMLDGLGMAETTPGPLIQVVQFVGFMGAYRAAESGALGGLHPMAAGTLAAVWTTWVTFIPCFLWIFLGAPYIERLRRAKLLTAALSAITAAVVGVVLNLALWFALHSVFGEVEELRISGIRWFVPSWKTIDVPRLLIALGAFLAMFRFKVGVIWTIVACVMLGLLYRLIAGR